MQSEDDERGQLGSDNLLPHGELLSRPTIWPGEILRFGQSSRCEKLLECVCGSRAKIHHLGWLVWVALFLQHEDFVKNFENILARLVSTLVTRQCIQNIERLAGTSLPGTMCTQACKTSVQEKEGMGELATEAGGI